MFLCCCVHKTTLKTIDISHLFSMKFLYIHGVCTLSLSIVYACQNNTKNELDAKEHMIKEAHTYVHIHMNVFMDCSQSLAYVLLSTVCSVCILS